MTPSWRTLCFCPCQSIAPRVENTTLWGFFSQQFKKLWYLLFNACLKVPFPTHHLPDLKAFCIVQKRVISSGLIWIGCMVQIEGLPFIELGDSSVMPASILVCPYLHTVFLILPAVCVWLTLGKCSSFWLLFSVA